MTSPFSESGPFEKLIYDVGAHIGEDSDYYLRKGFSVVAIEAYPDHVETLKSRFSSELEEGHFFLEAVAIGAPDPNGTFFVHSSKTDWHCAEPDERRGSFAKITVPFVGFCAVASKYPLPYYLKIDIEGNDGYVINQLRADWRPNFVSFEIGPGWLDWLQYLEKLGYRRFQAVDQSKNDQIKEPVPSREGQYVGIEFNGQMSGLFGLDLPDNWIEGRHLRQIAQCLTWDDGEWYDIHASLE